MSSSKQMLFSLAGLFIILSMLLMSSIFNASPSIQIQELDASWLNAEALMRGSVTLILLGTVLGMYVFGFSFFRIALAGYLAFWVLFDYIFLSDFVGPAILTAAGIVIFLVNALLKNRTDKMIWSLVVAVVAILFLAKDGMQAGQDCVDIMQDNLELCEPADTDIEAPIEIEALEPEIIPLAPDIMSEAPKISATFIAIIVAGCVSILMFMIWLWRELFNKKPLPVEDSIQQQLKRTMANSLKSFDFDQSEKSIVDCYQALLAVLEQNELVKKNSATAREFSQTLIELSFPAGLITDFTQLFEQARYQSKGMNRAQSEQAKTLLIQLVEHVESSFEKERDKQARANIKTELQGDAV
jgi:hypothetical protein